jgi:FKBP-type peptidyl-prolyl cis-trans isomerase FkpA
MATSQKQRIGIGIILAVTVIGTVGGFAVLILSSKNQATQQAQLQTDQTNYQNQVNAQTTQLSNQYFGQFSQYLTTPAAFDKATITSLTTTDLVAGTTGDALTATSDFTAYYIGWTPDGKVFDSSFNSDNKSLKAPFAVSPGQVIQGWTNGVVGMKVGGVRELSIPSDQAYGSTGSGSTIPPNTPLKFIIMVIPTPTAIPVPQDLLQAYGQSQ